MSTALGGLPRPPMFDAAGNFTPQWIGWFSTVQQILQATSTSGPTTARPVSNLYVGQFYLDTTLGIPIWCLTPGATPVWINASGASV